MGLRAIGAVVRAGKCSQWWPTATNRHQPPTIVQYCSYGFVSCPCLDHGAESVPVNVRFCWRYEGFLLFLRTPPEWRFQQKFNVFKPTKW